MKTLSWTSLVLFVLSLVTGVLVHVAGHVWSHQVWHNLSVVHIIFSVFFLGTYITHIVRHRKWYSLVIKKFDINPLRKRERNRIVELMIEKTVKIFWQSLFFLKNAENRVKLFWKNGGVECCTIIPLC